MVRRAAASNLSNFIEKRMLVDDQMIEVFQKLLKDPQDAVKTEAS